MVTYDEGKFYKKDFENLKKNIKEKEKRVTNLSAEIDLLTNNNKILKVLSTLSINREVIVDYRNNVLIKQENEEGLKKLLFLYVDRVFLQQWMRN